MNRRNFIKSCSVVTASIPFTSFSYSTEKRNPRSLFTIEELKKFCKMNNLHYVEDNEIWLNKYKQKMITYEGKNFWLYKRWPFLHKNNRDQWYECLRWNALNWQTEYKDFFLYDIQETTLPEQRGEFYSMILCSKCRYDDVELDWHSDELRKRIENAKVYCIKENCWYRPVIINPDNNKWPNWWMVDGMEKV